MRVPGDDNVVLALRTEMSGYDFRVVELADRPARRAQALSELAEPREAQAVLRAKPTQMAVELWTRGSDAHTQANEELVAAGPGRNPEVLAMRVTETMRARGLTLPPLTAAKAAADAPVAGSGASAAPSSSAASEAGTATATSEPERAMPEEPVAPAAPGPEAATAAVAAETSVNQVTTTTPTSAQAPKANPKSPPKQAASAPPKQARAADARVRTAQSAPATARTNEEPRATEQAPPEPQRVRPVATSPEPDTPPLPPRAALVYVEAGPAGVWSPGANRVGPSLDALVSVTFRPYQTSSISVVGLIPLVSPPVNRSDTPLEITTFGIGGFGDLHLPFERFELSAGLGALALISSVLATSDTYEARDPTQRLAALLARIGGTLSWTPDLRVSASVMGGLAVRELYIEPAVSGEPAVTWGRPLLIGTLSLELALPWDR